MCQVLLYMADKTKINKEMFLALEEISFDADLKKDPVSRIKWAVVDLQNVYLHMYFLPVCIKHSITFPKVAATNYYKLA